MPKFLDKKGFMGLAVLLWTGGWIGLMRHHFLDDAFIHLRYAENLLKFGTLTYAGDRFEYGDSSLLYTAVLAGVSFITGSVYSGKFLSIAGYLGVLVYSFLKARQDRSVFRWLWVMLFAVFLGPQSIRWMTDGMETSLWVLACLWLWRFMAQRFVLNDWDARKALVGSVMIFACVFARFEFAMTTGLFAIALLVNGGRGRAGWYPVFAAATALGIIYGVTGAFYPDTAIAKAMYVYDGFTALQAFVVPMAAAQSLGIGVAWIWAVSLGFVLSRFKKSRLLAGHLVFNALPLIVLCLIGLRGQAVQGVRCLLWCFISPLAWNLAVLEIQSRSTGSTDHKAGSRLAYGVTAGVLALLIAWPLESVRVYHIAQDRSQAFRDMSSQNLNRLSAMTGLAFDIGFISYFSLSNICDVTGLVMGRDFARKNFEQRVLSCIEADPDYLFVTSKQRNLLVDSGLNPHGWVECHRYLFSNVRITDPHYLLVKEALSADLCPEGRKVSSGAS